jgi:hypothetical protein
MNVVHINPKFTDLTKRQLIFDGKILLYTQAKSFQNLIGYAREIINEAFQGNDPETAQYTMSVEKFVETVAPMKTKFTNDHHTKELIRDVMIELGCDIDKTYFDVPRLRAVTSDAYLTAGVGYAYKAHRDTWYASPDMQVNYWLPVYDLAEEQTLSLYPQYWNKELPNNSEVYDYDEWVNVGRKEAINNIKQDTRVHPLPLQPVDLNNELRFVLSAGESLAFSSAYVHATAPNTSGKTRFSIDFRSVNIDDVINNVGAPNIDNRSTGTTLGDFFRCSDFERISPDLVRLYPVRTKQQAIQA